LILEFIENLGIRTVNSARSSILCNNKTLTTQILEKNNLPVPETVLAFSQEQALAAAEKIGFPVVVKPVWGSWGRLISKADTYEALEAILEHKAALGSPQHSIFYLQKFIFKPGRDIRVFIVGGKAIAAMYRVSEHWLTNTAKGAVPQHMELNKEIAELVEKAAEVLGVEIAGVDLVEYEKGYLFFEINATPEFHGLKQVANVNIAKRIVEYIMKGEISGKN
jgi:[lysine-biosynthesis-protein LysW]--L-2-aminoadipate ligase